jgi:hypothetical protein
VLELILGFFGELLLQLVLEMLAELGLRSVRESFRPQPNPVLALIGYLLLGLIGGGLSLLLAPHFLIAQGLRMLNLAFAPVLAGLAMTALGAWRSGRGQELMRLDRFLYGYCFALAVAAVRFQFAA